MPESPYFFGGGAPLWSRDSDYEDRYYDAYGRKPFGSGRFGWVWNGLIILVILGFIGGTIYAMLWRPDLLPKDNVARVIFGGSAIIGALFTLFVAAIIIPNTVALIVAHLKGRPAKYFPGRLIDVKVDVKEEPKDMRRSVIYTVTFEFTAYDNEPIQGTEKVVKPLHFRGGDPPLPPPPGTLLQIYYVNKKRFSLS